MFLISFFKNLAKLFINLICLLICLPIILIFVVLIYFEDKSNPIYSGLRVGKNFKLFTLYKLRSMILRENIGFQSTSINDKRILKIGKIIRSTKLDELPQIFNVLKGDLSLVGPRPHLLEEVSSYTDFQHRVFAVKPGITGLAQISGRSNLPFEEEVRFDLQYIEEWSPWLDLFILWRTIGVVLKGDGAD